MGLPKGQPGRASWHTQHLLVLAEPRMIYSLTANLNQPKEKVNETWTLHPVLVYLETSHHDGERKGLGLALKAHC